MKNRARQLYLKEKLTAELFLIYEKIVDQLETNPESAAKLYTEHEFDIKMLKDILKEDLNNI